MSKEFCGKCGKGFETTDDYVEHVCEKTGFTPKNPEHLGEAFILQSKKALERGELRKKI